MPPFREGPIKIDRKLSGEALHFLRDVGHGHRINIVDASYDIPPHAVIIDFPGTTAEAYEAIIRCIPIENENSEKQTKVVGMAWDEDLDTGEDFEAYESSIYTLAARAIQEAGDRLMVDGVSRAKGDEGTYMVWGESDESIGRLDGEEAGQQGFYSIANNPDQPHTFIRTQDDLPFACVSLVVGHSQRTE